MPRPTIKTIQPPLAGMMRRTGFQQEGLFSSYDTTDFWPINVTDGRAVTATRPALAVITSPGESVNMLAPINGFATNKPFQSIGAAADGQLYWFDGVAWNSATGSEADAVDTGRAVYAQPFLQHLYLCVEDHTPIDFDYVTGQATYMTALAGSAPIDCRMTMAWQGALWFAGAEVNPHLLFGSRTGDAYDWDDTVDKEDTGGAWSSGTDHNAGLLNGPITALINHTSDTAIVSTFEGLVALRGHPRRDGVFEHVSNQYVLGQGAWCKTPKDILYYMSPIGVMELGPQAGAIATPISRETVPDSLQALSQSYSLLDPKIVMAYSTRWNVIYITVRGAQQQAWLFDLNAKGFHKMNVSNYPYVMYEHKPLISDDADGVLWGKS